MSSSPTPMSVVSGWDNEYANLANAASQLRAQGLKLYRSDQQKISLQQGLTRLENSLDSLPVSAVEVQRRRRIIQHLRLVANNPNSVIANSVVGSTTSRNSSTKNKMNNGNNLMQTAMQQQDNMIDELASGVSRIKMQTQLIGDEANLHVNLMSDMENNLDVAQMGLESETRRASQLKEDQSVWRLQLIAAGLCIVMVLLVLMGLS